MLDFLFPKECLVCSKLGSWLCKKCSKKLVSTLPSCYICKGLSNGYKTHKDCTKKYSLDRITTIWKYNEYSKKLIYNYKYKNRYRVGNFLFSLFENKLSHLGKEKTLLIPIPSYRAKTLERGFNPTQIISELIAKKTGIEVKNDLIMKVRNNLSQASLSYEKRRENINNVFQLNKAEVKKIEKYKKILIVDDIITTGSTLDEIYKILRSSLEKDFPIEALCIFQGSFRRRKNNEYKKFLQSNKPEKETL